ncbi:hypothetical protein HGH92_05630 [Chitinophaga varians]|uniref:Uncharacterized protein n=1 Tax=Chitinophaga varians TaxID=2202339 RepID=A0A847RSA8_9BACT|nr:hypothetical protein [Chitinophaga varians]NLR63778.1 hypothetical protein [Chitinophaga varians]
MKEIRKPAPRRVAIGYLLAALPLLLFIFVFLFINATAGTTWQQLAPVLAQVLTAVSVGLAGVAAQW